ncbi:MAG TPA: hypothetical protein VGC87_06840 [Pyrinomonadaceae bacterium]|jgi:hypothetical protein
MSNFLDNLASRSLGLAPVARPRLASRFEPPPNAPRLPASAPAEGDGNERGVEGGARNARPEARQPETRAAEYRRAVPIPPPDAPRAERTERGSQAAPPKQSPPPGPAVAQVPVRPVETRAQSAQPDAASDAPPAAPPTSSLTEGARAGEDARRTASKSEDDDAALDNRVRRLMANSLHVGQGNEAAGGAPPVAQSPARRDETPEKTQTIRVTIGRIDVRAVTAPAPQEQRRAPARPAPQLSLADYLKQRGGGRR